MKASVVIDINDPTPPYEQIRRQIVVLIAVGALEPGEKLPTVRQLAGDLRVAPGTVSRAYKELESAGFLVTRRAAGTRVAAEPPVREAPRRGEADDGSVIPALEALTRAYIADARGLGVIDSDIAAAVARGLGGV